MRKLFILLQLMLTGMTLQAQQSPDIKDYFTPYAEGSDFYLYNPDQQVFINISKNPATATTLPTTDCLLHFTAGKEQGVQISSSNGGYMKIGFWGGQNVWTNGAVDNTDWVIEPVAEAELLYTLTGHSYNEESAAGHPYYLYGTANGFNATTDNTEQKLYNWAFVSPEGYEAYHRIILTNEATALLEKLITEAKELGLDTSAAEGVLGNSASTLEELQQACTDVQALIANQATLENPKDVTALYLQNADFETSLEGWTSNTGSKNNKLQTNSTIGAEANEEGAFTGRFWENWASWKFAGTMSTTAEGLPDGVYQFSLSAFANNTQDAYVFANNDNAAIESATGDRYHVITYITDGHLKCGINLTAASNNWVGMDNAQLLFYGNSTDALMFWFEHINVDLTTTHDRALDDKLYELAHTVEAAADHASIIDAIQQYKDVRDQIVLSTEAYEAYYTVYVKADELQRTTGIKASQNLKAYMDETYDDYLDGNVSTNEICARTTHMQELIDLLNASITAHKALNESFLNLENAMGELADAASDESMTHAAMVYEEVLGHISADDLTDEEIYALIQRVSEAIAAMRVPSGYENASPENPFDMTMAITNPSFDNDDNAGWYGTEAGRAQRVQAAEMWNKNFDMYQYLSGLPQGHYRLSVYGFYRAGWQTSEVHQAWLDGESTLNAILYAETSDKRHELPLKSVWEESTEEQLGIGNETLVDGIYTPNNMEAAVFYFENGRFLNTLDFDVTDNEGKVRIGLCKTVAVDADWTMFDNFRLTYLGKAGADVVTAVTETASTSRIYGINGVQRYQLQQGVNIVRKANGKVVKIMK